jgi:D-aminopeptidase
LSQRRIQDFGFRIGSLPQGPRNAITDVPGVKVGHCTISDAQFKTGVTVVLPSGDNLFTNKVVGASSVLNGFGKTLGLMQVEELGTIETPIALTNTLNVGLVHDALVEYMIGLGHQEGIEVQSVNPIVCECNDGTLNDIQHRAVGRAEVFEAIRTAGEDFAQGCVGAGTGTICHSLKGGIGSASRVMTVGGRAYTLGVLAQTNYGHLSDLTIDGRKVGRAIAENEGIEQEKVDKGSCILVVGTDLPVSSRQLSRILRRAAVGLARVGSHIGHGSGEVVVGFSTTNRIHLKEARGTVPMEVLNEGLIDIPFRACAEAVEEAILNSLAAAETTVGRGGVRKVALCDLLPLEARHA